MKIPKQLFNLISFKRMKKIFYLASIAALAFSSCAKDNTTEIDIQTGGAKITAAIAADETRTSLEKVDSKYEVRWSAGDQLGVYGVGANTLNNAAFVLDNASDGKAVGVFASQSTELKADKAYVAVYPRFQEGLILNGISAAKYANPAGAAAPKANDVINSAKYEDVVAKIPATQKYQNGSFYTQTVPSVSTEFYVNEDGAASLSMQPVVDYLMVNFTSTEPIYTLELELTDVNLGRFLLAGQNNLKKYVHNGEYRYYLDFANEDGTLTTYSKGEEGTIITLELDETYAAVACHKPNTYVFTVPANILGRNENVQARLTVNGGEPEKSKLYVLTDDEDKLEAGTNKDGSAYYFTNWTINYKQKDATKGHAASNRVFRSANATTPRTDDQVLPLENTIFWMNPVNAKTGERTSFEYNPYGDIIIHNEVELLRYINQYNLQSNLNKKAYNAPAGMKADEDVQYYGKDAFLCEDGSFDFSLKNMMELATEYENTEFEPYIAAYLADVEKGGGFPCFVEYTNNFIGNGAVIENIEQPLLSWAGIFGGMNLTTPKLTDIIPVGATRGGEFVETKDGEASITNVTFSNIVAKSTVDYNDDYAVSDGAIYEITRRGHVLAGSFDGTIKNVTVNNADGESIMGVMSVGQYNGLTIEGVSKLDNIATLLNAEASLDLTKTWDVVAGVKENVFAFVLPSKNAKGEDALHVITIPEGGAEAYANLTSYVAAYCTDSAVAVVIDGVSYWTGDYFVPSKAIKNAAGAVVGYQARYAEELAGAHGMAIELTRDFDLNYSNLQWDTDYDGYADADIKWHMLPLKSLNGAKHSISNVVMSAENEDEDEDNKLDNIAPFDVPVVKDFTLNNVYINVATDADEVDATVPEVVAGMTLGGVNAKGQTVITNATVNGLIIDTAREDNTNNTEANYGSYVSYIGWMVGAAADAQITNAKVNGIQSAVKGIAGLVAKNSVNTSSKFEKVSVANVDAVNTALANFTQWNPAKNNYNVMGTAVGLVGNNANRKADIKFVDCGAPVFLYYAPSSLTVIYDNVEKGSLKNK